MSYVSPFAARHLEGPALHPSEREFLLRVYDWWALPYEGTALHRQMLERGLLGLLPTLCGPALVVSTLACTVLGERRRVISADGAGNHLYMQRALRLVQAEGYTVHAVLKPGQLALRRYGQRSLLLARISGGGYHPQTVATLLQKLRGSEVERTGGEIILCTPEPTLYARLAHYHARLRVCGLAPLESPTRARTGPGAADTPS